MEPSSPDSSIARLCNRVEQGNAVVEAVAAHREEIVGRLAELNDRLPAEKQIDAETLRSALDWLGAVLDAGNRSLSSTQIEREAGPRGGLASSEDPRSGERPGRSVSVGEVANRERRDRAAATLRRAIEHLRNRIAYQLGDDVLATYGLADPIPRHPADLAEYCAAVTERLRRYPLFLDDPVTGHSDDGVLDMADELERGWRALHDAQRAVIEESAQFRISMADGDRAIAEWKTTYRGVASTLTGVCLLAGAHDVARDIRPTARRAAGREPVTGSPSGVLSS